MGLPFVLLGVALILQFPVQGQETPAGSRRWEYRVLPREQIVQLGQGDITAGLNRLGEEGWQLVAIEPGTLPGKNARTTHFYLQRPSVPPGDRPAAVQKRLAAAREDVALRTQRLAWTERMHQKGFAGKAQVEADKAELRKAQAALERAEQQLKATTPGAK
jgi:hypothetical protein